jgi:hypothetical protein
MRKTDDCMVIGYSGGNYQIIDEEYTGGNVIPLGIIKSCPPPEEG